MGGFMRAQLNRVLGVAGLVPSVAYNSHFVLMWMGPRNGNDGGTAIAAVAAVNALLLTLIALFSFPFVTTGRVRVVAAPAAGAAILNLVASVGFTKLLGPIGPLLGTTLAALSVGAWYLPWQLRKTFGTPISGLARAVLVPLPWGLGYWLLVSSVARVHAPRGWLGFLAEMIAWSVAFVALGTWTILGPDDRSLWRARLIDPILGRIFRKAPPPGDE